MNKVILSGRMVTDTALKKDNVATFRFAVNRQYKREGEAESDFFNCACFGKVGERFGKLKPGKGTKLIIDGEIRNNNYKDKNGVSRYEQQIIVNNFEFGESRKENPIKNDDSVGDDDFESIRK